jgi:hypothetical protein
VLTIFSRQLAVCHGLVINRIQELKTKVSVYTERCCRNSYGILVRQLYDPMLHQGEDICHDGRDKQKWAENQIHWLVQKVGQILPSTFFDIFVYEIQRGSEYLSRKELRIHIA